MVLIFCVRFEGRVPDLQLRFGLGACTSRIMADINIRTKPSPSVQYMITLPEGSHLATDASSVLGGRARGVGVPGSRFEMPAGTGIRRSFAGSRGAPWTTAGSGFPRHPGGVLMVSSQDLVDSS